MSMRGSDGPMGLTGAIGPEGLFRDIIFTVFENGLRSMQNDFIFPYRSSDRYRRKRRAK